VQEIALLGLWYTLFYEHAAFYGGSALRIFHGLYERLSVFSSVQMPRSPFRVEKLPPA